MDSKFARKGNWILLTSKHRPIIHSLHCIGVGAYFQMTGFWLFLVALMHYNNFKAINLRTSILIRDVLAAVRAAISFVSSTRYLLLIHYIRRMMSDFLLSFLQAAPASSGRSAAVGWSHCWPLFR